MVPVIKGDEMAVNLKREKMTLEVTAKDCKKCFLYRHCDYILYAICTQFEEGRNTKRREKE